MLFMQINMYINRKKRQESTSTNTNTTTTTISTATTLLLSLLLLLLLLLLITIMLVLKIRHILNLQKPQNSLCKSKKRLKSPTLLSSTVTCPF